MYIYIIYICIYICIYIYIAVKIRTPADGAIQADAHTFLSLAHVRAHALALSVPVCYSIK